MKVAKAFKWEAAHRLPWHEGPCRNLHGHSYRMWVELEGEPDARGMVLDFQDVKRLLKPLVEAWDHATLVGEHDEELLRIVRATGWKHYVLPYDSTAENLCRYVLTELERNAGDRLRAQGIRQVTVRIAETETCYAEAVLHLQTSSETENASSLKFYA